MARLTESKQYKEVYVDKYFKSKALYTQNLTPNKTVYDERLVNLEGNQYRSWDPRKSKLGAALLKGIKHIGFGKGDIVLYLGASTGTTVSHVSDIVGKKGFVYALDLSPQTTRPLVFLCEERKNIVPILADANDVMGFVHKVSQVDFLFQDIAQKFQVEIFLKNVDCFLRKGGYAMLSLKTRSIDITKKPRQIFNDVLHKLKAHNVEVVDFKNIDEYEKDHYLYLIKKNH